MKNSFTSFWVVLLCMQSILSFAQLQENFSDGDYTRNPKWILSDSNDWIINPDKQLQTNRMIQNSSYWISTPNNLADSIQWELDIQLLFNTSALNYLDIYLICSDSVPVSNTATGYFVRLGNTEDEISLYRKDPGNKIIKIIDGVNGVLNKSENRYRLTITRRGNARWSMWYDESMIGNKYIDGGTGIDSTYQNSQYFSLYVQQSTASFFQKHFIDNIFIHPFIPDKTAPYVKRCEIISPSIIKLLFNEPIPNTLALQPYNFWINNGIGQPKRVAIDSIDPSSLLLFFEQMLASGINYILSVKNIQDASANIMKDTLISLLYYSAQRGDIIINEILFNPNGSGSDYIEIMNRSSYPINMKGFSLVNISNAGTIINQKIIFAEDHEIESGSFRVFTEDKENIISSFEVRFPQYLFEILSLPSLPNDKGNVRLLDNKGEIIDELNYDENWHFPLLNQREGVALERIYANMATQNPDNWNSASKSSGYGTPTMPNSQTRAAKQSNTEITLSSEIFSPDQDGNDDILLIEYQFTEGGYVLNSSVFDITGRPVRSLQRNMLCGISGSFKWDGLDEKSGELPMGHYVVFTEIFNLKGNVKKFKNQVVLARRR